MATHSSVLAWRIPGMGEPGGLLSMGSHRVGHDWSNLAGAAAAAMAQGCCLQLGLEFQLLVREVWREWRGRIITVLSLDLCTV